MTELIRAVERERLGEPHTRPEDVRRRWLGLDGLDDTLLLRDHEDTLVGYAEFHADHDPDADAPDLFLDGQVAPTAVGRGIATFLLARAVARTQQIRRDAGADRAVLTTVVQDGNDRARAFFLRRGFAAVRHQLDLRLELDGDLPAPAWPDGVTGVDVDDLGPPTPALLARLHDVHQAAFADVPTYLPMDLEDFLASRRTDDTSLWQVAVADDEFVGVVLAHESGPGDPEAGWIRDLGVRPEHRRRGIAMAMLRSRLQAFAARGCSAAQLDVDDVTMDGAVALYTAAGMRIVRRTDLLATTVM